MEINHTITITEEAIINAKGKKSSRHTIPTIGYSLNGDEILRTSSIEDMARAIGAHPSYLGQCVNNKRKCKGWIVFHASEMESHVDEMIEVFGNKAKQNANDAEDAAKWREQEHAKEMARKAEEKRLADIAKAEEDRKNAIEKTKRKLEHKRDIERRKLEAYNEAIRRTMEAEKELEALLYNENMIEMEEVA